jgi:ankyrin repeat protein
VATLLIQLQRERNPELSLDQVLLTGIWTFDLEIARLVGPPGRDLWPQIVDIGIRIGFLDGIKYTFEFLSDSDKRMILRECMPNALKSAYPTIAPFLLREGGEGGDALVTAVKLRDLEYLNQILSHRTDADCVNVLTSEGTPLTMAVTSGDLALIKTLLGVPGVDGMMPDAEGNSPFAVACRESSSTIWKILADFCADSLQDDYYQVNLGFFWACQRSDISIDAEIIPFFSQFALLDPHFHHSSTSFFVRAAASGQISLLKWMLQRPDVNVNDRDGNGSTAAIEAARSKSTDSIELLLSDDRADFDLVNAGGECALSTALWTGSMALVKRIMTSGRVDMRISGGRALAVAFYTRREALDLLLLHPDLDVNLDGVFGPPAITIKPNRPREGLTRIPPTLIAAVRREGVEFIERILHHPTHRPSRDDMNDAMFESIGHRSSQVFENLFAEHLTTRDRRGDSLLSAAILSDDLRLAERIRDNPKFDFAQQDPGRCIAAVAKRPHVKFIEFLAAIPGFDLKSPLPHGLNGFPDVLSQRVTELKKSEPPRDKKEILQEGVPMLAASRSPFPKLLFPFLGREANRRDPVPSRSGRFDMMRPLPRGPLVDPDQKGKHGEPFFFHFDAPAFIPTGNGKIIIKLGDADVNWTDRHHNSAAICAVLAGFGWLLPGLLGIACDFTSQNENSDTVNTILEGLGKRGRDVLKGRQKVLEQNRFSRM